MNWKDVVDLESWLVFSDWLKDYDRWDDRLDEVAEWIQDYPCFRLAIGRVVVVNVNNPGMGEMTPAEYHEKRGFGLAVGHDHVLSIDAHLFDVPDMPGKNVIELELGKRYIVEASRFDRMFIPVEVHPRWVRIFWSWNDPYDGRNLG